MTRVDAAKLELETKPEQCVYCKATPRYLERVSEGWLCNCCTRTFHANNLPVR